MQKNSFSVRSVRNNYPYVLSLISPVIMYNCSLPWYLEKLYKVKMASFFKKKYQNKARVTNPKHKENRPAGKVLKISQTSFKGKESCRCLLSACFQTFCLLFIFKTVESEDRQTLLCSFPCSSKRGPVI